jgi:GxxExxY protein
MITTETLRHREEEGVEGDSLTAAIIGAAIEIHRTLGPGLLEAAYEECLCYELNLRGLKLRRQVQIPVEYKGVKLDCNYSADLLVNEEVILELKAVEKILPVHEAQLLTYMKLLGKKKGLLINFNTAVLKHGIRRRVL